MAIRLSDLIDARIMLRKEGYDQEEVSRVADLAFHVRKDFLDSDATEQMYKVMKKILVAQKSYPKLP